MGYRVDEDHFPDIYTLIQHHRDSPIHIKGFDFEQDVNSIQFDVTLTDAMLQPDPHLKEG